MEMNLHRYSMGEHATLGTLIMQFEGHPESAFRCYTLEDKDRQLENNPSAKVPGKTCIPRGRYQVIVNMSNRFKRELPLLLNVPGFEGIRIHTGNSDVDTDGCILVGTNPTGDNWIPNSKVTFAEVFKRIQAALAAGDKVWINVK